MYQRDIEMMHACISEQEDYEKRVLNWCSTKCPDKDGCKFLADPAEREYHVKYKKWDDCFRTHVKRTIKSAGYRGQ